MKLVVITGSHHKDGTTALLAEQFIKGSIESGNDVFRFDAAFEEIHPCMACDACKKGEKVCIQKDAMHKLYPQLIAADYVVFVTPVYYFGMCSQLKTVIDRFYAVNSLLRKKTKKCILITASGDSEEWVLAPIIKHYEAISEYLNWSDAGRIIATGFYAKSDIENSNFPDKAYKLGRSLI